jgi:hypothetical protein
MIIPPHRLQSSTFLVAMEIQGELLHLIAYTTILSLPSTFFDIDFNRPQFCPSITGLRPSSQYYVRFIKEYPPFNYGSFETTPILTTDTLPITPTRCSISISSVSPPSLVLNFDQGFHGEPSGTPRTVRIYYDTESFMEEDTITSLTTKYLKLIDLTKYTQKPKNLNLP